MYTSILFKELMRYVLVHAISKTIFTHVTRGRWVSAALQDPPPPGTHCHWAQRRMAHSLIARCCWGSGVFHADTLSLGSALLCTLIRQYSTLTHCHWAQRRMTHTLSLGSVPHYTVTLLLVRHHLAQSLVACCHWVSSVLQMPPSATQGWRRIAHSLVTRCRWVASQSTLTHDQHRFAHSLVTPCRWAQRRRLTLHTFSLGCIAFYTDTLFLDTALLCTRTRHMGQRHILHWHFVIGLGAALHTHSPHLVVGLSATLHTLITPCLWA
jgi:hypothetical protein